MPQVTILRSTLLVAIAAGALLAEEGDRIRAVRIGAERVSASDHVRISDEASATGEVVKYDAEVLDAGWGGHIELVDTIGKVDSHHAWLVGIRGSHFDQKVDSARVTNFGSGAVAYVGPIKESVTAFDVEFGFALVPSRGWDLEIMPFAGYGSIDSEDRAVVVDNTAVSPTSTIVDGQSTARGPFWELGVRASVHYRFDNGMELGAEGGYRYGKGHSNVAFEDRSVRYDVTFSGATYGVVVGYRF